VSRWLAAAVYLAATTGVAAQDCDTRHFGPCQACHALTNDAGVKPGPRLAGVIGRPVAGDPAFDYSPALRAARGSGDLWTRDRLDAFLADPEAMYPGQWMGSPPIRDSRVREALLCVLGGR
jgi:cytochrome c